MIRLCKHGKRFLLLKYLTDDLIFTQGPLGINGSIFETAIRSCNEGQRMQYFDSCQWTFTWMTYISVAFYIGLLRGGGQRKTR